MDRDKATYAQSALTDAVNKLNDYFTSEYKGTEPMHFRVGNITYDTHSATVKIEVSDITDSGEVQTKEAVDFGMLAFAYGLKPEDLGTKFVSLGKKYEIIGLKRKSHKYPILARRGDGQTFKFKASSVVEALNRGERG